MPNYYPGQLSWERSEIPKEIQGEVVKSLDELRAKFDDSATDVLKGREIFPYKFLGLGKSEIYGIRENGTSKPVGYSCGACDEIRVGPPKFEGYNNARSLSGGMGHYVKCEGCNSYLKDEVALAS